MASKSKYRGECGHCGYVAYSIKALETHIRSHENNNTEIVTDDRASDTGESDEEDGNLLPDPDPEVDHDWHEMEVSGDHEQTEFYDPSNEHHMGTCDMDGDFYRELYDMTDHVDSGFQEYPFFHEGEVDNTLGESNCDLGESTENHDEGDEDVKTENPDQDVENTPATSERNDEKETDKSFFYCAHCDFQSFDLTEVQQHTMSAHAPKSNQSEDDENNLVEPEFDLGETSWKLERDEECDSHVPEIIETCAKTTGNIDEVVSYSSTHVNPAAENIQERHVPIDDSEYSENPIFQCGFRSCHDLTFKHRKDLSFHVSTQHKGFQLFYCAYCQFAATDCQSVRIHTTHMHSVDPRPVFINLTNHQKKAAFIEEQSGDEANKNILYRCLYCETKSCKMQAIIMHTFNKHRKIWLNYLEGFHPGFKCLVHQEGIIEALTRLLIPSVQEIQKVTYVKMNKYDSNGRICEKWKLNQNETKLESQPDECVDKNKFNLLNMREIMAKVKAYENAVKCKNKKNTAVRASDEAKSKSKKNQPHAHEIMAKARAQKKILQDACKRNITVGGAPQTKATSSNKSKLKNDTHVPAALKLISERRQSRGRTGDQVNYRQLANGDCPGGIYCSGCRFCDKLSGYATSTPPQTNRRVRLDKIGKNKLLVTVKKENNKTNKVIDGQGKNVNTLNGGNTSLDTFFSNLSFPCERPGEQDGQKTKEDSMENVEVKVENEEPLSPQHNTNQNCENKHLIGSSLSHLSPIIIRPVNTHPNIKIPLKYKITPILKSDFSDLAQSQVNSSFKQVLPVQNTSASCTVTTSTPVPTGFYPRIQDIRTLSDENQIGPQQYVKTDCGYPQGISHNDISASKDQPKPVDYQTPVTQKNKVFVNVMPVPANKPTAVRPPKPVLQVSSLNKNSLNMNQLGHSPKKLQGFTLVSHLNSPTRASNPMLNFNPSAQIKESPKVIIGKSGPAPGKQMHFNTNHDHDYMQNTNMKATQLIGKKPTLVYRTSGATSAHTSGTRTSMQTPNPGTLTYAGNTSQQVQNQPSDQMKNKIRITPILPGLLPTQPKIPQSILNIPKCTRGCKKHQVIMIGDKKNNTAARFIVVHDLHGDFRLLGNGNSLQNALTSNNMQNNNEEKSQIISDAQITNSKTGQSKSQVNNLKTSQSISSNGSEVGSLLGLLLTKSPPPKPNPDKNFQIQDSSVSTTCKAEPIVIQPRTDLNDTEEEIEPHIDSTVNTPSGGNRHLTEDSPGVMYNDSGLDVSISTNDTMSTYGGHGPNYSERDTSFSNSEDVCESTDKSIQETKIMVTTNQVTTSDDKKVKTPISAPGGEGKSIEKNIFPRKRKVPKMAGWRGGKRKKKPKIKKSDSFEEDFDVPFEGTVEENPFLYADYKEDDWNLNQIQVDEDVSFNMFRPLKDSVPIHNAPIRKKKHAKVWPSGPLRVSNRERKSTIKCLCYECRTSRKRGSNMQKIETNKKIDINDDHKLKMTACVVLPDIMVLLNGCV